MLQRQPFIPLLVPQLPRFSRLKPYLEQIDSTRRYTNFGPFNARLEKQLAKLVGADAGVCVSSGSSALELALAALELPPGSKVALPSLNFPSAALAILRNGHIPVFCDADGNSGLLQPNEVERAQRDHLIAAAMPSCLFGCGYETDIWDSFCRSTNIPVIIDGAGAIGFQSASKVSITAYSLHATKPLAAGEGGFLATPNTELCERVRKLSNFGFTDKGIFKAGNNAKLSEYHAAVALASVESWKETKRSFNDLFKCYVDAFVRHDVTSHASIVNHSGISTMLVVCLDRPLSSTDLDLFAGAGVETRRWYWPPLHHHELFARFPRIGPLDATEHLCNRLLGLPYHLDLEHENIDYVASTLARLR